MLSNWSASTRLSACRMFDVSSPCWGGDYTTTQTTAPQQDFKRQPEGKNWYFPACVLMMTVIDVFTSKEEEEEEAFFLSLSPFNTIFITTEEVPPKVRPAAGRPSSLFNTENDWWGRRVFTMGMRRRERWSVLTGTWGGRREEDGDRWRWAWNERAKKESRRRSWERSGWVMKADDLCSGSGFT